LARLPKGLQEATMDLILERLPAPTARHLDCGELARLAGLSKVTVRRYLNHLVQDGTAESVIRYDTGGRPGVRYRLAPPA
jgi:response regulator of citrate/malate metabolism